MTKEELKEKLSSKENKLAKKLIDLLNSQCDDKIKKVQEILNLAKLMSPNALNVFFFRDPHHPRSKYRIEHVLDYLLLPTPIIMEASNCEEVSHQNHQNHQSPQSKAKEDEDVKIFELLIESNFTTIYPHILNNCFYIAKTPAEKSKKQYNMKLAKILVKHKKVDINSYAMGSYLWSNCLENLSSLLELGANPKGHQLVDSAISYVACSNESQTDPKARLKVIDKLLSLGATAKRPLEERVSNNDITKELCQWGIVEQIQYQIQSYKLKEALKI